MPTRHPTFCQPVPSSVDVNLVKSNRPDHVDFFGYDFDTTPGIKVYLESTNGSRVDVTSKLIMNTAFQVTVPFGANGVAFDRNQQFQYVATTSDSKISP